MPVSWKYYTTTLTQWARTLGLKTWRDAELFLYPIRAFERIAQEGYRGSARPGKFDGVTPTPED